MPTDKMYEDLGSVTIKEGREPPTMGQTAKDDAPPQPINLRGLEGTEWGYPEAEFHAEHPKPGPVAR